MATVLAPPSPQITPAPKAPRLATSGGPVIALRSAGQRLVTVCAPSRPAAKLA